MSYCPELDSRVRDKVEVVLDLSNQATEKNVAAGVDLSNLVAKRDFIALKTEVDNLNINKLVNVPTGLNNLKTKVHDLDANKLKNVPVDLKKLRDVVNKALVKKTVYNKLNTKVNEWFSDYYFVIKKVADVKKKIFYISGLVCLGKQIIMLKYQALRKNISPLLVIKNLQVKYLMQR